MRSEPPQCQTPDGRSFTGPSTMGKITNFNECVAAGNPVMESYPRQCQVPGGKTFVSQADRVDMDKDVTCRKDNDCRLINVELGWSCCWAGSCDPIDYREDKWIAVNEKWFTTEQTKQCPSKEPKGNVLYGKCGPAPGCPAQGINENFEAKCIKSTCQKVPK